MSGVAFHVQVNDGQKVSVLKGLVTKLVQKSLDLSELVSIVIAVYIGEPCPFVK